MRTHHLRRGGVAALLAGILLLAGAPFAARAEEPAAPADPAALDAPPPTEGVDQPSPPETPPESPPSSAADEPATPAEPSPEGPPPADEPTAPTTRTPAPSSPSRAESLAAPVPLGTIHQATLKAAHVGATNPGFQTGTCPANPFNDNTWGWHFVLPGNSTTFVTLSATFQNAGTITQFLSHPTGKHAYVWTPGPDTLLGATATVDGPETEFNLSHVCTGTTPAEVGSLSVVKAIQGTPGGPFTINVTCTLDEETVVDVDLQFSGAGQQQVDNIPAGAVCDVTETDDGGATSVSYSADPPQNITIVAGQVAGPVTVTNTFGEDPEVGALEVTKAIAGTPPPGAQFLVHVTCVAGQVTVVDQDLPLFTGDGQSHGISGIPAGAECTVTETGSFGAAVSYSPDPPTVTIVEDDTAAVTVTNTYETGGLQVIKAVTGPGSPAPGTEFEVHVVCEFANQTVVDETLVFGETGGSETIDGLPAGAECSIDETEDGGAASVTISPENVVIVGGTVVDSTVTNAFAQVAPTTVVPTTGGGGTSGSETGPEGSSTAGRLAFTGVGAIPLAAAGTLLLLVGSAAVIISRRRAGVTTL